MFKIFKRKKILRNTNALDLIPVRIHRHRIEDDGSVTLLIPKFKNEKFARFIIPASKSIHISIELDELGSAVWLAMNGVNDTAKICRDMSQTFGEKIHPAEERIVKFLSGLYHNKHISFKQLEEI